MEDEPWGTQLPRAWSSPREGCCHFASRRGTIFEGLRASPVERLAGLSSSGILFNVLAQIDVTQSSNHDHELCVTPRRNRLTESFWEPRNEAWIASGSARSEESAGPLQLNSRHWPPILHYANSCIGMCDIRNATSIGRQQWALPLSSRIA